MIGYADDLLDLWDIPLQPEPETTRAFPYNTFFINNPFRTYKYSMRFAAEQYIWYAFTKKKGLNLSIRYLCHLPLRIIPLSLLSIIDNFIIASPEQLGILIPESITHKFNQRFLYTHEKWNKLYEEFCVRKSGYQIRKHTLLIILCSIRVSLSNIKYFFIQKIKYLLKR